MTDHPSSPRPLLSQSIAEFGKPSKRDEVQARVEQATEAKRMIHGGAEDLRLLATATEEGSDLGQSQLARDLARLGMGEIAMKYGSDMALDQSRMNRELVRVRDIDASVRDPGQKVKDAALGVGAGAVSGVGGIAAFGAGVVSDRAGAAISTKVGEATEGIRDAQSAPLQSKREQAGYRAELDRRDIARDYEEDLAAGRSFPELRRFGRETLRTLGDLREHPDLAGDLVSEGVGSLVGSAGLNGIAARGIAKTLLKKQGITGDEAKAFLKTDQGRELIRGIAQKGMPASIGALEGGGAYVGIQAEIQAMDEAELSEGSEEYRGLRAEGLSHEEARDRIANIAGMEGGAIQGLIGAATGKLVAKFEADPLSLGRGQASRSLTESLSKFGSAVIKEGTEEAIQGASSSATAGYAIQRHADADRDPLEGAGSEMARGLVAGAGMAGVLRAPEVAAVGALTAGETAARAAGNVITKRAQSVADQVDAASPVGSRATGEAEEKLRENLVQLSEALNNPETSAESNPEPLQQRVQQVLNLTGPEINSTPDSVKRVLTNGEDIAEDSSFFRTDALSGVRKQLEEGTIPEEDQADIALWLHEQAQLFDAIRGEDLSAFNEQAQQIAAETEATVDAILASKTISAMVERARTLTAKDFGPTIELNDKTVETPEAQQAIRRTVALAQANPAGVDPDFVNQILNQRRAGKLPGLSQRIVTRLQNAAAHARDMAAYDLQSVADGEKTQAIVQSEILSEGKSEDQWGLTRYLSEIENALDLGRIEEAQAFLSNLRNFGEHMQNKVQAATQSAKLRLRGNNKVPYRTWTGSAWVEPENPNAGKIGISPFNENSLDLGRTAVLDARSVTNLYNNLLKAYGRELKGSALPQVRAPHLLRPGSKGVMPAVQARDKTPAPSQPEAKAAPEPKAEAQPQAEEKTDNNPETVAESTPEESLIDEEDAPSETRTPDPAPTATTESREAETREESEGEAEAETRAESDEPEAGPESRAETDEEGRAEPAEDVADEGTDGDRDDTSGADADDGGLTAPSFDHLAQSREGQSRFARAYRINLNKSPLMAEANPAQTAVEALKNPDQLGVEYTVPSTKAKQLAALVETEVGGLVKRMNERLKLKGKEHNSEIRGGKYSPLELLQDPAIREEVETRKDGTKSDLTAWPAARALNIVDPATGEYDPRLIQLAGLAAMHWVMTAPRSENLDTEEVAKIFGVSEHKVTPEMVFMAQRGLRGNTAAESLARVIREFWGADTNPEAPLSDSLGISQAVAAELLVSMKDRLTTEHRFRLTHIDEDGKEEPRDYVNVELSHPSTAEQIKNIGGMKGLLADAFLPQAEKPVYFDRLPDRVRQTQKGNPQGRHGRDMLRALRKHQEIPFYRNSPYVELMKALGQETYARLMGARDVDPEITNKVDALSIEGRNRQLLNAWQNVVDHDEKLAAHAEAAGKPAEEVATHFDWYTVSNERIHADGFNPQSDKTMREAVVATVSTLDLTKPKDLELFWITVAQSVGVKTEKGTRTSNVEKAQDKIDEKYRGSIAALQDWLSSGKPLSEDQVATLREETGDKASPKLLHALLAVARAELSLLGLPGGENASQFQHSLSLEADGKTDGPINAMVHFLAGRFTRDQLVNMAKGGAFFGSGARTLNEHIQGDKADLYETAAVLMRDRLGGLLNSLRKDPKARPQAEALTRLMNQFLGSDDFLVDWKTGQIEIGRGTLKNPLTITVYGSGKRGIAGKVANGLLELLYARMSKAVAEEDVAFDPETLEMIRAVTTRRVYMHEGEWKVSTSIGRGNLRQTAHLGNIQDIRNFEFSAVNREMLLENMLTFVVGPMSEAIETLMGSTQEVLQDFQAATQVQSAVMVERFRTTVRERLAEKRTSGELGASEFLTQADYNAIFRELARYGAVIEGVDNDAHHLNLSSKGSAQSEQEFARAMNGDYSGKATLPQPSDAGVSASPMMTISRGDAAMMVNFFASQEIPDADRLRTLPVFDGLEMPADGIDTISEMINKAVADAWLENPAQDVADSFADWMRQGEKGPLEGVGDRDTIQKVSRALGIDADKVGSLQDLEADIVMLRDRIQENARSIQARKNVYKRIGFSVDHMASGERPYVHEGEEIQGDLVEGLNRLYDEELAKLEKDAEAKADRPVVEEPSAELQARVEQLGTELWDGIFQLSSRNAVTLLTGPGVSPDTRRIAKALSNALPDFTFFFGPAEALTRFRNEITPEFQEADPIQNGQIDLLGGAIYIANTAGETVLHEMLHAATARLVHQFYSDPESIGETPRTALDNLERLMTQFVDMDFSNEDPATARSALLLGSEIRKALTSGDQMGKAQALSEFIAWSLSNQNLIEVMRKSRVRTPLRRLAYQALGFIRKLFGLRPDQRMDMFSNIAMNVNAVLAANGVSRPGDLSGSASMLLNQVSGKSSDPRLDRLMQDFDAKIGSHLRLRRTTREAARKAEEGKEIRAIADEALNLITAGGFQLDEQQKSAFRSIQAALASSMQLDSKALIRIQKLFTHVMDQLDLQSFNTLMDRYGSQKDAQGRSTLLASFLALSQVDPAFRKVLAETRLPKDRELKWDSVDAALTSMAESLMNSLSTTISGEGHGNKNALDSLDRLTAVLARIEEDDRSFIEKEANRVLGAGDDMGKRFLSKAGDRITSYVDQAERKQQQEGHQRNRDMLIKSGRLLAGLIDENRGKAVASAMTSFVNEADSVPKTVLEVMNEVFGITDETRGVYDLVNRVKYAVSGMRQDHRETLPGILAEQFSRKLSKAEWSQLHLGLARTDIAALGGRYSAERIRQVLTDEQVLEDEIAGIEETLKAKAPKVFRDYMRKADELARFMVRDEIDPSNHNLLRNAEAIARLLGEKQRATPTPETVRAIDELVTLYAVRELDETTREKLAELGRKEAKGVDFLTYYLADLRRREQEKHAFNETTRLNGYKGYAPSETAQGVTMRVADDREHDKLVSMGYTRLGDYKGAGVEGGKKGYYFSTVSGRNTYQQGVMQTVQTSAFGVDPRTGRTLTGTTAGMVSPQMVSVIKNRLEAQGGRRSVGEALMPIYGADGEVMGYERSMAPERLAALSRNTHLGEMIGAWAGRQAEEELAQGFNRKLVDRLHEAWVKGKSEGRAKEFVDLSDPKLEDPIQREAWKLVPPEMRDYISQKFGDGGFMVRKDMVNNAVGYRAASVADAWTGQSRVDEKTRKAFVDTATALMGKNAFPWLVRAEKFWQAGVSVAKNTIVIRSVIVPLSNLGSNFLQLTTLGVGARDIAKGFSSKLVEIDQHLRNLKREVEIKALMARHHKEPDQLRKLKAELKLLDDANRRMSIWPLIEAGEFSTISEGLTEADAAIGQGQWAEWMQDKIDRIPAQLGTAGRYAVIARDTALFKGMSRAVQYGDFLAKAVLYDHLTKREGKKAEDALKVVAEEFVNYNLLPGRVRSYTESMGLAWFWAYKLRSLKIAHRHIRDNPLRALLTMTGSNLLPELPGVSIGSPITDNAASVIADGRAGYSVGPGMLFNAPSLNPWVNIAN